MMEMDKTKYWEPQRIHRGFVIQKVLAWPVRMHKLRANEEWQ